ncbi:MAG: hypothetical protein LKJ83_05110 [Eubacteriaceae bacterium]|jgi:hypothetical protein|nr:hypothetical protein [Eubacteriaceae bacterium]
MEKKSFAAVFFRLYDRKIASGEITFSRTGINKTDFTNLCIDPSFVFPEDDLRRICENMALTEEEKVMLLEAAGYAG